MVEDGDPLADVHHEAHVVFDQQHRQPELLADPLTSNRSVSFSWGFIPAAGSSSSSTSDRGPGPGRSRAGAGRRTAGSGPTRRRVPRARTAPAARGTARCSRDSSRRRHGVREDGRQRCPWWRCRRPDVVEDGQLPEEPDVLERAREPRGVTACGGSPSNDLAPEGDLPAVGV